MKRIGLSKYIQNVAEATDGLYWPGGNISMCDRLFIAGLGKGFLSIPFTTLNNPVVSAAFDSPKYLVGQIMVDIEEGYE